MHVIAKGALIGGSVGALWAVVRSGDAESGTVGRYAKSVAEGAVAGAGVGFLLDQRLRQRAVELVSEHGPTLVDTISELATDAFDAARPRVAGLADLARDRAEHAYDVARPHVVELADVARDRAEHVADVARDRAAQLRSA